MRIQWLEQRNLETGPAGRPIERPLRLATGLILFAYATSHLLNHAFGIRSVAAMEAASAFLLAPWQTYIGLTTLYTSFLVHGALGLRALYRRRHLRMPAGEAWQLGLGLAIPLLLIPHAGGVRIGSSAYGMDGGFDRVIYQFWVASPDFALPRQLLLLLVVWVHGCIGVRAWLASKPWYRRASAPLASLATLVPVVALLGFISAGLDLRDAVHRDPSLAQHYAPAAAGSAAASKRRRARLDRQWARGCLSRAGRRRLRAAGGARLARQALSRAAHHLSGSARRRRADGLFGAGGKPVGGDPARVDLRRPRPLLHLPNQRRGGCGMARASEPERAPDARSHPGPVPCPLGLPDPSLRRPVDRAARSRCDTGPRPRRRASTPRSRAEWSSRSPPCSSTCAS